MRIRKNDQVLVIAGRDHGKRGRVLSRPAREEPGRGRRREHDQAPHEAEPAEERQGRHRGARGHDSRQQRDAASIPRRNEPTRVGAKVLDDGRKVRVCAQERRHGGQQMSRLKDRYQKDVVPALRKEFGYKNPMAVPKIEKVVVNMGLGEATQNAKIVDTGADELGRITGQKPVTTRAKKSIAQFKVRAGHADRHDGDAARRADVRVPRPPHRDRAAARARLQGRVAEGASTAAATTRSGLRDQLMFPEIDYMKVDKARGMNISRRHDGEDRRRSARSCCSCSACPSGRTDMATTAKIAKETEDAEVRRFVRRNRCQRCGRPRGYLRKFQLCRLCFRQLALEGDVAGVTKSSW